MVNVNASSVRAYFEESARAIRLTGELCDEAILEVARRLSEIVRSGGKIMICGNGGSAADAQHWAAELVSRLTKDFERPAIGAMALTTDTSVLTAYANDYDFGGVFARQVEALGRAGDALVVVSTSGNSENLCRAVQAARARHVACLGVLGCGGGRLFTMLDAAVVVPGIDTCRIQEAHAAVIHVLCSLVEQEVFGAASSRPSMSVPR